MGNIQLAWLPGAGFGLGSDLHFYLILTNECLVDKFSLFVGPALNHVLAV